MSEEVEIRYYLNGVPTDKVSINWESAHTIKVIGNCAYVTTATDGQLATRYKAVSFDGFRPQELEPSDFITLTVVTSKIKEEVRKKLVDSTKKIIPKVPRKDSLGNTPNFYKELGIDPPEDFKEDLENEVFEIKKSDYELEEKLAKIRPELIEFMVNNEEFGCTLYVSKDFTITVKESVEEVENKIKKSKNGVK
jgi:hypothetical protein